ncbi:ABC-type transport system permease protein (probable substrate biotin) [Natronomonas pharaonis DSM 2160]|uniref:ABC-type transport system permease protein (Probable substrate biotin) n=1 Tax=Natronomonas pharaonis (strain ATCC 35678 / DSM 2160 / CIP 103997 / JCM 8858 / NBRC 14720 / NCIMB 2260 / Gabara) TaxID=348780 RepID=A0A1U7EUW6_NATPD|nr:energy-coupling factor transporter transmembrane protein EcfT [Natronomonas pharaonis]CAI48790.1 ABC-type transport system permease protein (probable substrate biotin) [Natronomonas pharaonis DSM 2160]
MLSYVPGDSPAHRLDPRSKLAVQLSFAALAFAYTTPTGLAVLTVFVVVLLRLAATPVVDALRAYSFVFVFLLIAPLLEGLTWGSPWFVVADAVPSALAGYRVLLVLLVAAAYVRTTPVRESRAAVQWAIPGRVGQFLGMSVSFVFRFLPVLRADIGRIRDAHRARLGTERPIPDRMRLIAVASFNRAFERADRLALALRARCFSWNPTVPQLRFGTGDLFAVIVAVSFSAAALHSML